MDTITTDQLCEMTSTELLALLSTTHLTAAQVRAIRTELKQREI
jgi:hypothetical protein